MNPFFKCSIILLVTALSQLSFADNDLRFFVGKEAIWGESYPVEVRSFQNRMVKVKVKGNGLDYRTIHIDDLSPEVAWYEGISGDMETQFRNRSDRWVDCYIHAVYSNGLARVTYGNGGFSGVRGGTWILVHVQNLRDHESNGAIVGF